MKRAVLFSLKNNEKVFINVVCCSLDWRFKGLSKWVHFQGKHLYHFFVASLFSGVNF